MTQKILELKNLKKHYPILKGVFRRQVNAVKALDGINLDIYRGECLGMVGESGCGKTTTSKAIIRLHDVTDGDIYFNPGSGESQSQVNITSLNNRSLKKTGIRGKLQMVFQDPTTSLNPRMLVKNIVGEPLMEHESLRGRKLEQRVLGLLRRVGLTDAHMMRYPHEFSGGQRQRIAVARAIATNPEFIVLDEPTSALDVSVQAQILNLLKKLQEEFNLTYLFVTHHLLVVKYISQRIVVMYLGKIVEIARTSQLFKKPYHPYTHALLSGIPVPNVKLNRDRKRHLLSGDVPSPIDPPAGCRFHTRCPFAVERCSEEEPDLVDIGKDHQVACFRRNEINKLIFDKYGSIAEKK